ncbi:MAG: GDP-mannose 4,6-dehydratase [Actinobacteria bacterium]|nr:GDP-mannose 4,6-dehydratase [Actinomycetota bacterium]
MSIIITGMAGFVGRHLADHLIKTHLEKNKNRHAGVLEEYKKALKTDSALHITGVDRIADIKPDEFVKKFFPSAAKKDGVCIDYISADLKNSNTTEKIICSIMPDRIYHLAAQSSVSRSWENPRQTFEDNVFPGINIFESVKKHCPQCRVLVTCTAEEYGFLNNKSGKEFNSIDERAQISPSNPYAVSKASLDFLTTTYQKAFGLALYVARSFNHTGPGQSDRFVVSDFAKQIAEIEAKTRQPVINVGNLDVYRDFLDVRDVVNAYFMITEKAQAGSIYNVCSGKRIAISEILDILIALSSCNKIRVRVDKEKIRPVDTVSIYGDNSRLKNETGWRPCIDIKKSLEDTLNWWRERSK